LPIQAKLIIANVTNGLYKKFFKTNVYIRLAVILSNFRNFRKNVPSWWKLGHNLLLFLGLSVGIHLKVGFRPQLVVVSGLSVGIPLTVRFRPQLVVVLGLSVEIPFDGGILGFYEAFGYHEAFSETFPLSRWNFGYHEAFYTNFSFSQWNFGYQGAFHPNFSFSQ
jgi:hypothetical protein